MKHTKYRYRYQCQSGNDRLQTKTDARPTTTLRIFFSSIPTGDLLMAVEFVLGPGVEGGARTAGAGVAALVARFLKNWRLPGGGGGSVSCL